MAKFFFQINDDTYSPDDIGTELPNIRAAQHMAVQCAGQLIHDHASKFWDSGEWGMTVTSDTGLSLFTLQLMGTISPTIRTMAHAH